MSPNQLNKSPQFNFHVIKPSLWFDDMDVETIEVFQSNHRRGTDQETCSFSPDGALTKTYVNRLIKFS